MENYLKSLTMQLIDLEAQSPLMSNEKFRSEAISFLKGLLKIVNSLIPADKQSNFDGLKNLGIPKFTPSHDELISWGFNETTWKGYFTNGTKTILYSENENKLFEYKGMNDAEIPFTTKEEFMKAVGVEEKRANVIKHETLSGKHVEHISEIPEPTIRKFDNFRILLNEDLSATIFDTDGENIYFTADDLKKLFEFLKKNIEVENTPYIPSEEVLKELGFENCDYKSLVLKTSIGLIFYYLYPNEFIHNNQNKLNIRSDAELKMIVEILGREK